MHIIPLVNGSIVILLTHNFRMQPNFWCDYCYRQTIEYIWFWSSKWPWKWPTNWPIGWANPFMDRRGKPLSPSLIYLLVEVLSTGPTELGKTLKSILWYWPIDSGLKVWHGFMAQPGTSFVPNIYWLLSSLFCYILMCPGQNKRTSTNLERPIPSSTCRGLN